MILKHLRLIGEHPTHFELHDMRNNKSINIAKPHIGEEIFKQIRKLPKLEDASPTKEARADRLIDKNPKLPSVAMPSSDPASQHLSDGGEVAESSNPLLADASDAEVAPTEEADAQSSAPNQIVEMPGQEGIPEAPGIMSAVGTPNTSPSAAQTGIPFQSPQQGMQNTGTTFPGNDIMNKALSSEQTANTAVGDAQASMGKQTATVLNSLAKQQQDLQDTYQAQRDNLTNLASKYTDDIANFKIQPYWEHQSTGNKISAAIALGLGSLSQGFARAGGSPNAQNPAVEMINKAIDQDMEAQKLNLGKKESLLSNIYKQTGNLDTATNMAKAFSLSQAQAKIQTIASNTQDPLAKQHAALLNSQIDMQKGQLINQQAMYGMTQNILNGQGGPNSTQGDPIQQQINFLGRTGSTADAKQLQGEYETFQNKQAALNGVDDIMKRMSAIQTPTNRLLNPIQSTRQLSALEGEMYPLLRKVNPGSRMTEFLANKEIVPYFKKVLDNPETTQANTEALKHVITMMSPATPKLDPLLAAQKLGQPKTNFPQITTPIK